MALSTLIAWCIAGAIVAALLLKKRRASSPLAALLRASLHVALWPLFLPELLPEAAPTHSRQRTGWDERIERAEATLGDALRALGHDLDDPLALEWARVAALGRSMRHAAARLDELDAALALPVHDAEQLRRELDAAAGPDGAAVAEVLRRRLANVQRLEAIRRGAKSDLERALAEAAALASRLTLLRYEDAQAGAAALRARELTDTVDELCRALAEARAA